MDLNGKRVSKSKRLETLAKLLFANDPGLQHVNVSLNDNNVDAWKAIVDGIKNAAMVTCLQRITICKTKSNLVASSASASKRESGELSSSVASIIRSNVSSLSNLELLGVPLGDEDCVLIADSVVSNSSLKKLTLAACKLRSRGIKALTGSIIRNPSIPLSHLDLHCNDIGGVGCVAIAEVLSRCGNLKSLCLKQCGISAEGVRAMMRGIRRNSIVLEILDLSFNPIRDAGCAAIAGVLSSKNAKISCLKVQGCNIRAEGARDLAASLRQNSCALEHLNFSGNDIGDRGCVAIAEALAQKKIHTLKVLDLSWCGIGNDGASAFASILPCTSGTLEQLKLDRNQIDRGCVALMNVLSRNSTLKTLNLNSCYISKTGWKSLSDALATNYTLQDIGKKQDADPCCPERSKALRSLALNKERPIQAEAVKTGVFPPRLLSELGRIPCLMEALAKVVSFQNQSSLYSFLRQHPSFADSFSPLPKPTKRQKIGPSLSPKSVREIKLET